MLFSPSPFLSSSTSQPIQQKQNAKRVSFAGRDAAVNTARLSPLAADVFEPRTRPVKPSPQFGGGAGIERHHKLRAMAQGDRHDPMDALYFRNPPIHVGATEAIQRLQESTRQPLPIVIDGDFRGKDAASQMMLLHAETKLDYPELAQRFPIIRRDIYKNDLDNGLKLVPEDQDTFEDLRMRDAEKYEPVIRDVVPNASNPTFRQALGKSRMVDITDPTLPAPAASSPNVRMAMQILHYLEPEERMNYIRDLAKNQGPGSLLILGSNEAPEAMPEIHAELERLGYQPAPEDEEIGDIDQRFVYQKVQDVEIPARDPKIEALIHSDALKKNPHVAMVLSANGLDPFRADGSSGGWTLLHSTAGDGVTDAVKELIKVGIDPNIKDDEGQTALHLAAEGGFTETAKELVNAGADPKIWDNEGKLPQDLARRANHFDTAKFLKGAKKKKKA